MSKQTIPPQTGFVAALLATIKAAPAKERAALAKAIDDTWRDGSEEWAVRAARALTRGGQSVRPVALHSILAQISDACRESKRKSPAIVPGLSFSETDLVDGFFQPGEWIARAVLVAVFSGSLFLLAIRPTTYRFAHVFGHASSA